MKRKPAGLPRNKSGARRAVCVVTFPGVLAFFVIFAMFALHAPAETTMWHVPQAADNG